MDCFACVFELNQMVGLTRYNSTKSWDANVTK